jgi:hypothetical protein
MSARMERPARHRAWDRRLVWAVVLLAPAVVFVNGSALQYGVGVTGAADWFNPVFTTGGLRQVATVWIVAGPLVAFLLAASRVFPIRLVREAGDTWEIRLRVRVDWPAILVASVALLYGGFLIGHLVAENMACLIGVKATC